MEAPWRNRIPTDRARNSAPRIRALVADAAPESDSAAGDAVAQAIVLARRLQERARELQTSAERRQQAELDRMIQSPSDKATLVEITDQAFRARLPHRAADQLVHILDVQGVPRFFSALDRTLLRGFQSFGAYLPGVAMPLVKDKMQHETANVVLPAEEDLLREHLEDRRREGVRMNVNYLGEALLGEADAERRLQSYLAALQRPEIEVMSVKISTIYSQISALARQHTVDVLCDRLELLYRAAAKGRFTRADGAVVPKFVYLDMEEYRDKDITAAAFMRTLDRPGLEQARAGIALQAYIPDSFATQRTITEWARRRVAAGGGPVTIRIVKGANMEMERVEAILARLAARDVRRQARHRRQLPPHARVRHAARESRGRASRRRLAQSVYARLRADARRGRRRLRPHAVRNARRHGQPPAAGAVELAGDMLLYAPACRQEDFVNAIGYLVRRLDENTGPDNFLRHAFNLEVDSPAWRRLEQGFLDSFRADRIAQRQPVARKIEVRSEPARNFPPLRPPLPPWRGAPSTGDPKSPERRWTAREATGERGEAGTRSITSPPTPLHQGEGSGRPSLHLQPPASSLQSFANEPDTDWSLPQNSDWAQTSSPNGNVATPLAA